MSDGLEDTALIVIAKEPIPGGCKTRLCPPLQAREAAALAEAALADTLATIASVPARRHVLALEGRRGSWLPSGFEVVPQRAGGLGERLAGAFADVGEPALLVGMDTPQLTPAQVRRAIARLARPGVDAVLGPAEDGGYWAIGLRKPAEDAFAGVPMSSARTLREQRRRLDALGLRHVELDSMLDFDTIGAAARVAELCPGSRFAAAFASTRWPRAA